MRTREAFNGIVGFFRGINRTVLWQGSKMFSAIMWILWTLFCLNFQWYFVPLGLVVLLSVTMLFSSRRRFVGASMRSSVIDDGTADGDGLEGDVGTDGELVEEDEDEGGSGNKSRRESENPVGEVWGG